MKEKIQNLIKYILSQYPYKSELSVSRLTKILYLADWKSALENNKQITDAKWYFNHYGPYVDDFVELATQDENIELINTSTILGGRKKLLQLKHSNEKKLAIDPDEKKLIDYVINATKSKNYEDFIKLVYSTYPVLTSGRYSELDLINSAGKYKKILAEKSHV